MKRARHFAERPIDGRPGYAWTCCGRVTRRGTVNESNITCKLCHKARVKDVLLKAETLRIRCEDLSLSLVIGFGPVDGL